MIKTKGITALLAVILAVLLAAGCGPEEAREVGEREAEKDASSESDAGESEETSRVVIRETSVPETTASAAEATGSTAPGLEDVILTNQEGGSEPVQTFRTRLDGVVYVSGETVGLPDDTELIASWIAEEVPEYENKEALSEEEILSESIYTEGDRPFELGEKQDQRDIIWAPGKYRVEVSVDGALAETLDFNVFEPAPPILARPGRDLPNAPPAAPQDIEPTNLQFIVDASGSMNEPVDGTLKMDAARNALQSLVSALPEGADSLDVGLRAYSHREASEGDASCDDTELLAPIEGVKKPDLRKQIDGLEAVGGRTPMANSVEQAAGDFPSGGGENVVVLVSDGKENCSQDPVAAIRDAADGAGLTVHVVGFDIGEARAREQLQEIAEVTDGVYVDAQTPDELTEALREIAEEQVEIIQIRTGAGELVFRTPNTVEPNALWDYIIKDESGAETVSVSGVRKEHTDVYQLQPGMYTVELKPEVTGDPFLFRFEVGAVQETVLQMGALQVKTSREAHKIFVEDQATGRTTDVRESHGPYIFPPAEYDISLEPTFDSDPTVVAEGVEVEPSELVVVEVSP